MSASLPYLVASVCFILALQGLSSPTHARRGNLIGAAGMLVAVVGTLIYAHILTFLWIAIGLMVGSAIGAAMS
ncbi:MAG TPA: NAD(P)(+) transhydrogenase (Re/Si-specific) subunit beta, partial [Thermoanaerobaculia bacterium]|nr:NAD(P)(+) transhydrogenase (Re/Si-specific) subunit beta [Thermoanaerobaculia bacterium]